MGILFCTTVSLFSAEFGRPLSSFVPIPLLLVERRSLEISLQAKIFPEEGRLSTRRRDVYHMLKREAVIGWDREVWGLFEKFRLSWNMTHLTLDYKTDIHRKYTILQPLVLRGNTE